MTEHTAARKLTAALRATGCYVWKINANFAAGIPDMWIAGNGADLWLELKWKPSLPKTDKTQVVPSLSAQQLIWLTDRYLQGVRVSVVLASSEGWVQFDSPEQWQHGLSASEARQRLVPLKGIVDAITRQVSTTEVHRHESTSSISNQSGTATNSSALKKPLATAQKRAAADPNHSSRDARHHARQLHAVHQLSHRGQHRLCAGDVSAAGSGSL